MKQKDLFGNIVEVNPEKPVKPKSKYQQFKADNSYRKGIDSFCKDCQNFRMYDYHNKFYRKCVLLGESHSTATDIKAGWVCDKFIRR